MSPLEHLKSVAEGNHARIVSEHSGYAIYHVTPPNPSGAPVPGYILEIRQNGTAVSVKEQRPLRLPAFCAERHINTDGTFCLYWDEVERLSIKSPEDAEGWWGKLLMFLLRQRTAEKRRRWPGKADERAHGSIAPRFQAMTEENAAALGPKFLQSFRDGKLHLRPGNRRNRVALFKDGRPLVTILRQERRVMTLRQRCKCDKAAERRLPLIACGDHGKQLADFSLHLEVWQRAEKEFYADLRARQLVCCGTMDDCPLAKSGAQPKI